jgi:hypothetical protein
VRRWLPNRDRSGASRPSEAARQHGQAHGDATPPLLPTLALVLVVQRLSNQAVTARKPTASPHRASPSSRTEWSTGSAMCSANTSLLWMRSSDQPIAAARWNCLPAIRHRRRSAAMVRCGSQPGWSSARSLQRQSDHSDHRGRGQGAADVVTGQDVADSNVEGLQGLGAKPGM